MLSADSNLLEAAFDVLNEVYFDDEELAPSQHPEHRIVLGVDIVTALWYYLTQNNNCSG